MLLASTKDAANQSTMHKDICTTENYPVPKVNGAEAEWSWAKLIKL